jgi:hypothetical protein
MRNLLGFAAVANADMNGEIIPGFPIARIDLRPFVPQADSLCFLAVLPDYTMQQNE